MFTNNVSNRLSKSRRTNMEEIIKKAMRGGYKLDWEEEVDPDWMTGFTAKASVNIKEITLDPLFWQALATNCKWQVSDCLTGKKENTLPLSIPLEFYRINLTEGWDKAIEYLQASLKK